MAYDNIGMMALSGAYLAMVGVGAIVLYIYLAFAWMTIAKKLKYKKAWLAWIPIANMFLVPILAGKKWYWGFMFFVPIANIVFAIMWMWKIFEKRKYPGWLALIPLAGMIPFIGFFLALQAGFDIQIKVNGQVGDEAACCIFDQSADLCQILLMTVSLIGEG